VSAIYYCKGVQGSQYKKRQTDKEKNIGSFPSRKSDGLIWVTCHYWSLFLHCVLCCHTRAKKSCIFYTFVFSRKVG